MSEVAFQMLEDKVNTFVEESQDFLDENEGSYLTLHLVEADRSDKQIARYNTDDESWPNIWLQAEVKRILAHQRGARLRLRRWQKGGGNGRSCTFEVGSLAEASPAGVLPVAESPPAPAPMPATPAPRLVAPAAAPSLRPAAPAVAPSPSPMWEGRLGEMDQRLGRLAAEISGLRAQPYPADPQAMPIAERALSLAQEAQGRAQQMEGELRRLREELGEQRNALIALHERLGKLREDHAQLDGCVAQIIKQVF